MDYIEIDRKEASATETISFVTVNGQAFGVVLEPPKKGNEQDISCIPTGVYKARKYESQKFNRTCIALYDVHGREYIAIHNGIHHLHTEGCLIVGLYPGEYEGKRAAMQSKAALKMLTDMVGDDIRVTIREAF